MKVIVTQLFAIASNTVLEALRGRVFLVALFLAILAIGVASALGALSLHQGERVFHNVVFFVSMLFLVALATFQGVASLHREISSKTIYTVLSRPVTRAAFLAGKFLGAFAVTLLAAALVFGLKTAVALWLGYEVSLTHLAAYTTAVMQLAIVIALAMLFSSFAGPPFSSVCTVLLFVAGNLTPQMEDAAAEFRAQDSPVTWLLEGSRKVIPDFEKLNLSFELTYGMTVPISYIGHALAYSAGCITVILLGSLVLFGRRTLP